jgi:ATPase family associated with various cellular activities (AAA)
MSPNIPLTLTFLAALTRHRLAPFFGKTSPMPEVPVFADDQHPFTRLILDKKMSVDEFVALSVGLVPHLQPAFFDDLVGEFLEKGSDFLPLGGIKTSTVRTFLPTCETVLFLLAGSDLDRRIEVQRLFDHDHYFLKENILQLEEVRPGEPAPAGRLILDPEWVERIIFGKAGRPRFSMAFPAQLLETGMEWEDLVLTPETLEQIREIETWVKHGNTLMNDWGMHRKLKPGYRALFHGPPGTGKTLTASLLGKYTNKEVYRIDLSMVISKFIGETEKNLSNLFSKAENKDWILFFDEADALFGKRTGVKDAHDKYANQEVSYLLQRVEQYNGLVILATNFKSNIDDAFSRRFQSIIYFPSPGVEERHRLWKMAFPAEVKLADDINLATIAQKYELTGAEIINVVQFACLRTLDRDKTKILFSDIYEGVRKEFQKEGRILR